KARKEQLRQIREQQKAFKEYEESYNELKEEQLSQLNQDSLSVYTWSIEDSLALSKQVLYETDFPEKYIELIENPIFYDEQTLIKSDSVFAAKATNIIENQAERALASYVGDGLGPTAQDPLSGLASNPLQGGDLTAFASKYRVASTPNPNMVKPSKAQDLIAKIDGEQFEEMQGEMGDMKKKYSEMPDMNSPEGGTKRISLKETPFYKRIYFGGKLNLPSTDPLIVNSSLQLGYWLNKKWMLGAGFEMREQFKNDLTTSLTGDSYGYSYFNRYNLKQSFFTWAEFQRQINRSIIYSNESGTSVKWEQAALIGIGMDFKILRVRMNSIIMYDFLHRRNDLNPLPFVMRVGFQFTKKPGK
ncbi:MAG: hypothetical protein ABJL71_05450, partial [Cyclobacteriaceae bacterium]